MTGLTPTRLADSPPTRGLARRSLGSNWIWAWNAIDKYRAARSLHTPHAVPAIPDGYLVDALAVEGPLESQPVVVELDLGVIPSPAGSGELLLTNDDAVAIMVFVGSQQNGRANPVVIATFHGCQQVTFGYPNDSAQSGHPLYQHGEWAYGFHKVLNSGWQRRLAEQNRVAFPTWKPTGPPLHHFLVAMHESLGESLAEDVSVEITVGTFEEAAKTALARVMAE